MKVVKTVPDVKPVQQVIHDSLNETTPETTVDIPGGFTEQPGLDEVSVSSTSESVIAPNTASSPGSPNNPSSQGFRNIFSLSKFLTTFDWTFKYIILFKVFGIKSSSNGKKDQNKKNATTATSTTAANT
ncbi:hypothetical protein B5S27_g330 [[Candida] boidinii]|nr:hypothetical protein B5S27_g330 [[Candida] boidinii]